MGSAWLLHLGLCDLCALSGFYVPALKPQLSFKSFDTNTKPRGLARGLCVSVNQDFGDRTLLKRASRSAAGKPLDEVKNGLGGRATSTDCARIRPSKQYPAEEQLACDGAGGFRPDF